MEFNKEKITESFAIKITTNDNGQVIGRAFLYVLKNELHQAPFGFLEDVFVEEAYRKQGIGSQLVEKVIEEAKAQGCYKLIGNSRMSAEKVHSFYERLGFKRHGFEFRIDF